ncbi:hypothetical protein Val02_03620 [Virgisporangium aliadipatigenens]|uniref:Ankyrin repeat domain-containing protein n=1 Tax=Virgisporangium aliadipatigenens TaxID=741659 RepID=A0A8J3YGD5_9ACTN|nr:hypothetical protein Val02_03620 [Virgisporangium aliadipatigenens]
MWMYERATERRLAGDRRGACEAARVDVAIDLAGVHRAHGAAVAQRLEDDLRHLVPDLLRWHFPRDDAGLLGGATVRLACYGRHLDLTACRSRTRPHRISVYLGISLMFRPDDQDWLDLRPLWDSRHTDRLRHRIGGGDRTPFFHRDGTPLPPDALPPADPGRSADPAARAEWTALLHESGETSRAWQDAGFRVSLAVPRRSTARFHAANARTPAQKWALVGDPRVAFTAVAARVAELPEGERLTIVAPGNTYVFGLELGREGRQPFVRLDASPPTGTGRIPRALWERPPYLDLLRAGQLTPEGLHPLVRTALFPEHPAPPEVYRPPPADVAALPLTVRVPCSGTEHEVTFAGGGVRPAAHSADEIARERTVVALGGAANGCVTAIDRWRGIPPERPPGPVRTRRRAAPEPPPAREEISAVRSLRDHALLLALHGDGPEFARLLDAGLDPTVVRTPEGHGVLHLVAAFDVPDGPVLVRRLVGGGMDVDARAGDGSVALLSVIRAGGAFDTVRALLDAGADPTACDRSGATALHAMCEALGPDSAALARLLIDAGAPVATRGGRWGYPPLAEAEQRRAPAEVLEILRAAAVAEATGRGRV